MYANRGVSAADLNWWATSGAAITYGEAVNLFATSSAAVATYPFFSAPTTASPDQYINQVFKILYNIDAADTTLVPKEEFDYWKNWLTLSPTNYLLLPDAINNASAVANLQPRLDALINKSTASLNFQSQGSLAGSNVFTTSQYDQSTNIISNVTADPVTVEEASATGVAFWTGGGGTTTNTFTLLDNGAVLTDTANSKVAPGSPSVLTAANQTINALTFLGGSFISDPSTKDTDVLTAQILGFVTPNINNVETIKFTGAANAAVDIAGISGVKLLEVSKNDLQVSSAETFPVTLGAGYASTLTVFNSGITKEITVNLNGTVAGATIVDFNSVKNVNLVVQADSVLKNADTASNTLTDFNSGSDFVITGTKDLTIDGNIFVAAATDRLDASAFEGKLTLNLGKFSNLTQIVGGKGDDTFTVTEVNDQINGITLNGAEGTNTLTVKVGNTVAALNGVTNINKVVLQESTASDTFLAPADSLVASGQTLTVDASSFTTKFLFFNGGAETNGSFNITGGSEGDDLRGGAKNDILTGNGGNDFLVGNAGDDLFVVNKLTAADAPFIADFTVATNNSDKFGLSKAAYAGSPDVGATLVTSLVAGAVNLATTVLVDTAANIAAANLSNVRFAYGTNSQTLLYDSDGNFGAGSVVIANTNAIANPLTGVNFSIVA